MKKIFIILTLLLVITNHFDTTGQTLFETNLTADVSSVNAEGDIITYTYVITNNVDLELTDVEVSSELVSDITFVSGDINNNMLLDWDETWVYTAHYSVLASDIDNNGIDEFGNPDADGDIDCSFTTTLVYSYDDSAHTSIDSIEVAIATIPAPIGNTNFYFCEESITLTDIPVFNTDGFEELFWYAYDDNSGTVLNLDTVLTDGTTYYAFQSENSNAIGLGVTVYSNVAIPAPIGSASQSFCSNTNPIVADLLVTNTSGYDTIFWFSGNDTGEEPINPNTILVNGTTYYAFQGIGSCAEGLEISVSIEESPSITTPSTLELCDNDDDGEANNGFVQNIDLTTKDAEILNGQTGTVSYHFTVEDALGGINTISSPFENTIPFVQTIYVRLTSAVNSCFETTTLDLVVNPIPEVITPSPLEICDDEIIDGVGIFNLTDKDEEIANGQLEEIIITYHETFIDAHNGENALVSPYTNLNNPQTIHARLEYYETGCYAITTLDLRVLDCSSLDSDGDGVTDDQETLDSTNPDDFCDFIIENVTVTPSTEWNEADCDGDGAINNIELINETNPLDGCSFNPEDVTVFQSGEWFEADCDGDGLVNEMEWYGAVYPNHDTDSDGVIDVFDIDDDNDGILSIHENEYDNMDGDGLPKYYDLDSDGDAIPDNVEAQSTLGYIAPSGNDLNHNGLDDAYDETNIVLVDTDGDGIFDFLDTDTDNDGLDDVDEKGFTLAETDTDNDGLDDAVEENIDDGYADVNGNINNPSNDLLNSNETSEVNYREASFTVACNTEIDAGDNVTLSCEETCTTLEATFNIEFYGVGEDTTAYTMTQDFCLATPEPGTILGLTIDDLWSDAIDIGFDFSFFGNTYNQLLIGGNGIVSFDVANANTNCPWEFSDDAPSSNLPTNAIFGAYHDIDVSAAPVPIDVISFYSTGEAPYRFFVINYTSAPHYVCNEISTTQQIVLYETSNIVAVNIINKPSCVSWNNGNAILGIQNDNGTIAYVPPGRNTSDSPWETSNESWQFIPENISVPEYSFAWLNGDTTISNELSVSVCPTETTTYTAALTLTDADIQLVDDVNVIVDNNPEITDFVTCDDDDDGYAEFDLTSKNEEALGCNSIITHSVSYYISEIDATNASNPLYSPYINIANPQTIYTRIENNTTGTFEIVDFELIVNTELSINQPTTYIACDDTSYDGFTAFDLTSKNDEITDGVADLTVSYHLTAIDAESGINNLNNPYTNTTNPQTVYARVENEEGCYRVVSFDLQVIDCFDLEINVEANTTNATLGDVITYTSTLSGWEIQDVIVTHGITTLLEFTGDTNNDFILNASETWIYTSSYTVTDDDVANESIDYCVIVNANDQFGNPLVAQESCTTVTTSALIVATPYLTNPIPYQLYGLDTPTSVNTDDSYTDALDINFNFKFFGNSFDQVLIGDNGVITFDTEQAGGYCPWSFSSAVPSPDLIRNAIFGPYQDIYNTAGTGTIAYGNVGTAPFRKFVAFYEDVPLFSCNELTSTNQIIIYETYNFIDIQVEERSVCNTWQNGAGVIGIQNIDGTEGYFPENRNTGSWYADLEGYRFTPEASFDFQYIICDPEVDGFESFDLNVIINAFDTGIDTVVFAVFENRSDAENNSNALISPYTNTTNSQTLILRIEDITTSEITYKSVLIAAIDCNADYDLDNVATLEEDLNNNGNFGDDDTDGDAIPDFIDEDDDGDYILTNAEALFTRDSYLDTDGDGIPNYLDNDDDGDGTLTLDEDYNGDWNPLNDDLDADGIPDFLDVTVVGTVENKFDIFSVFPNPAKDLLTVSLNHNQEQTEVILSNVQGQIVYNTLQSSSNQIQIDITDFSPGVYFVEVKMGTINQIEKIIIE